MYTYCVRVNVCFDRVLFVVEHFRSHPVLTRRGRSGVRHATTQAYESAKDLRHLVFRFCSRETEVCYLNIVLHRALFVLNVEEKTARMVVSER